MLLARVDGNIVSTVCHPSMRGWRHALVQPLDEAGNEEGGPMIVLDPLGAGEHQKVVISSDGKATRETVGDPKSPLRYMVIAIVDD